jgi:NADH-quinone oxidoreductase subunit J
MSIERILFYLLSAIVIGSALFVASTKNLVRSVFIFFITLFALAGLYVLCLADFVAITQIVIYVGGILVLILFAFMLSGRETLGVLEQTSNRFFSMKKLPALLLAVVFFVVLVNILLKAGFQNTNWIQNAVTHTSLVASDGTSVNNIGVNFMTTYLLPFEIISIVLMIALIGAAHLSRKETID